METTLLVRGEVHLIPHLALALTLTTVQRTGLGEKKIKCKLKSDGSIGVSVTQ